MRFLRNADFPWTERPGYSKKIFLTERDLGQPGVLVQEIRIRPGEVAAPHFHKQQTEIFYFRTVNGTFMVNGKQIPLKPGGVLVVEPNDVHETKNDTSEDFLYIAFKLNAVENDYFEA